MKTLDFNINSYVMVRLTEHGRKIHRANADHVMKIFPLAKMEYKAPEEDDQGWSKWQAWDLMQNFGRDIAMGAPEPFETTIKIVID